jgi:addiction module RelE/StbE family toxin
MWEVYEGRSAAKQLDGLPTEILKRYEKWKDVVRVSGPSGLRKVRGFNDESLSRDWAGHRSSRLNEQYRVIYRVLKENICVEVVRVSAHDYRRR